jgi:hypothetical protein
MKESIENLYSAFSKYHIEANFRERCCDCCVSNKDIKQLLSKPLKKLEEDDLRWFMSKAITTFGNINDYKHFLPRILELMLNRNSEFIEDFIIYEKLNYSNWKTWDITEVDAIINYLISLWLNKIEDDKVTFNEIHGLLEIIETYVGIDRALEIWEKHASKQSILFIVDLVWNNYNFKNDKTTNLLFDWFSSEIIKEKIQVLYFETKDKSLATKISVVYTTLDNHERKNTK